jgi:hypothetical protein
MTIPERIPEGSASPAELDDSSAIAFGGPVGGQLLELTHCLALGCYLQTLLDAGFCFAIESLRDRRGASDVAEQQDFDLKVAAFVGYLQHISDADLARGFGRLAVALDSAETTGMRG